MKSEKDILQLRVSNIGETQKRINRVLGIAYLLALIMIVTWHATNFEESYIDKIIKRANKALEIEELRPLDDFLKSSSCCFRSFYYDFKNTLVTENEMKEYAEAFKKENEKYSYEIKMGIKNPIPVERLDEIIQAGKYKPYLAYWAKQDTLVAFLLSIDNYLNKYFWARYEHIRKGGNLNSFWSSMKYIGEDGDSILTMISIQIDTIKTAFERNVKIGYNPFLSNMDMILDGMPGRYWAFDDYSEGQLGSLIEVMEKLNYISHFKNIINNNHNTLDWAEESLASIMNKDDSTFGSDNQTINKYSNMHYYPLSFILNSNLFRSPDLPDSVRIRKFWLPKIAGSNKGSIFIEDDLINYYYPDYIQFLKEYKLDKISGIKTQRNILTTIRGNEKKNVQAIGIEISSHEIFYFIPLIALCFYILLLFLVYHLYKLANFDELECQGLQKHDIKFEVFKSPSCLALPLTIGIGVILLPSIISILLPLDQVLAHGKRGVLLNSYYSCSIMSVQIAASILLFIRWKKVFGLIAI
jgi:hypothetical protein